MGGECACVCGACVACMRAYVHCTWPIGAQHPFLSHLVSSSPAEAAKKEITFAWTLPHVFYDYILVYM